MNAEGRGKKVCHLFVFYPMFHPAPGQVDEGTADPRPTASAHFQSDMSGSGRPRTTSFAEPQGASGAAATSAGSAAVVGSNLGKPGVSQASADSSSACANLKLSSEYISEIISVTSGHNVWTYRVYN